MSDDTPAMRAIVAGPDEEGIGDALEAESVAVERLDGVLSRPALEDAGIVEADLYVLTDVTQATTIPIARDLNEELRAVVYAHDTIPEFVRGQVDLVVDPAIADAALLADELAGAGSPEE